jgi:hypothetical protein
MVNFGESSSATTAASLAWPFGFVCIASAVTVMLL